MPRIAIGGDGGLSIPNLTAGGSNENPLNTGYSSRLGPQFGAFVEIRLSDAFSLEPGIQYSSQGGKKNGLQALSVPDDLAPLFPPGQAPSYLYANYDSEAKLGYLVIPLLAKFGHTLGASRFRMYVDAGPFVAFLTSAKQVTSGESPLYLDAAGQQPLPVGPQSFDETDDIKDQLNATNVGLEGNVGVSYRLGRDNDVFVEAGGNYGVVNIQKGSTNGKNNTGAATVVFGYSRWIGR